MNKQNHWIEYTEENIIASIDYNNALYHYHWIHFEDGEIDKYILVEGKSDDTYSWMSQLQYMMIGNFLSWDDYYTYQHHLNELESNGSKPTNFMKCQVEVVPEGPNSV